MTLPVFNQSAFLFEEGEPIPDHAEGFPNRRMRDPALYHIEGFIPCDGDFVWLAINLRTLEAATQLVKAARRQIANEIESAGGVRTDALSNAAIVCPNNVGAYSSMNGRADQFLAKA